MIDPSTASGTLILNILAGIGLAAILTVFSWLLGPLKWPIQAFRLRKVILNGRRFRFFYNPETNKSKVVTFCPNGKVGEGRNHQENRWRIRKGKLEIFDQDEKLYSRFRHDPVTGRLIHTNDADTRSIMGQFFIPEWKQSEKAEQDSGPHCE